MSEITRKLATVERILDIKPIEGADAIEVATVRGWKVVVKKGEYQVGDLAIYIEIDAFIPTAMAPFLTKPGHFPKVYEGIEGERLRTVKLRGTLSQGLILPLSVLGEIKEIAGKTYARINTYSETARTRNANISDTEQENR